MVSFGPTHEMMLLKIFSRNIQHFRQFSFALRGQNRNFSVPRLILLNKEFDSSTVSQAFRARISGNSEVALKKNSRLCKALVGVRLFFFEKKFENWKTNIFFEFTGKIYSEKIRKIEKIDRFIKWHFCFIKWHFCFIQWHFSQFFYSFKEECVTAFHW